MRLGTAFRYEDLYVTSEESRFHFFASSLSFVSYVSLFPSFLTWEINGLASSSVRYTLGPDWTESRAGIKAVVNMAVKREVPIPLTGNQTPAVQYVARHLTD